MKQNLDWDCKISGILDIGADKSVCGRLAERGREHRLSDRESKKWQVDSCEGLSILYYTTT